MDSEWPILPPALRDEFDDNPDESGQPRPEVELEIQVSLRVTSASPREITQKPELRQLPIFQTCYPDAFVIQIPMPLSEEDLDLLNNGPKQSGKSFYTSQRLPDALYMETMFHARNRGMSWSKYVRFSLRNQNERDSLLPEATWKGSKPAYRSKPRRRPRKAKEFLLVHTNGKESDSNADAQTEIKREKEKVDRIDTTYMRRPEVAKALRSIVKNTRKKKRK